MQNLRKVDHYNIALDDGSGSVGWAVTDQYGELCSFKSKPTWGSRMFPSADSAASARVNRGQRRRYDRRRQRLDLLQMLFTQEMAKVDPEFFIRLNQARLWREDREEGHADYRWPLFNDSDFTEADYYSKYPTIYHLRSELTEMDEKADIRLIYLACHNIVKARGNFLWQGSSLSAKNANMREAVQTFCEVLTAWCEDTGVEDVPELDADAIEQVFYEANLRSTEKAKKIEQFLSFSKEDKPKATAISKLIVGNKADLNAVFGTDVEGATLYFSNDDAVEAYRENCPDEGAALLEAMYGVYSAFVLMGILKDADGKTISFSKVREYEKYNDDLALLKGLVRDYKTKEDFDTFFRGEVDERTGRYLAAKAQGYTKFNLSRGTNEQEAFYKMLPKYFAGTAAESDSCHEQMLEDLEKHTFLRRLKTSDNGVIPYQLHLEELRAIIEKQSKYYPFLADEYEGTNKIESLVTFRIPYYVGPLTQKNAAKDELGNNRFAWSERFEGKENERIYPWNWQEIIDRDASAENFMYRMIGQCTYLRGEQVMARCSLTYEMFCVLNELAGARYTHDGDKYYRFSYSDRIGIIEYLFKKRKTVSYKAVAEWLEKNGSFGRGFHVEVKGGQGETGFESKLNSYNDFCAILGVEELSFFEEQMVEELVLWNTLFEDRDILKRKIKMKYGERLTPSQITKICKKRYTGWGNLSKKLLTGIKLPTSNGEFSVLELLEEGDQNSDKNIGQAMTFMEIFHDDRLGLQKRIDELNDANMAEQEGFSLNDLPGSPALRRSINQSLRIVDEIVTIAGKAPDNIFIEVTRDAETPSKKMQRTRRRYDAVKQALEAFKGEDPKLWEELCGLDRAAFTDRLELYFIQRGKCMYSGEPLDINLLSKYHIDHIIPQSYIKDDSIENRVLVLREHNERKSDTLLIDPGVRSKMKGFWTQLHEAKLIGDKKYRNLMRNSISDDQMKGFIARQLVETSQVLKIVQRILKLKYPETNIVPVKASLSSDLRKACDFPKCREINDYHHAHDAYLACQMGRFLQYRHSEFYEDPIRVARMMRAYIRKEGEAYCLRKKPLGSSGYFVSSFMKSGFDKETGELFKDKWDAEAEIDRMRKCLNYKTCFISRMPEETSGAFWDATVYSPKDSGKALSLPLKKGLDPNKYGSYSGGNPAYFFIYKTENQKGRVSYFFEGLPVYLKEPVEKGVLSLSEYARSIAKGQYSSLEIVKDRILKYQRVAFESDEYYIPALDCVYSSRQLCLDSAMTKTVTRLLESESVTNGELSVLYDALAEKSKYLCSRFGVVTAALESGKQAFMGATFEQQQSFVQGLLSFFGGQRSRVDLLLVGGSKNAGSISNGFLTKRIADIEFIDQSVTGMFERRYKLEL